MKKVLLSFFCIVFAFSLNSQIVVDDFETGLDGWEIYYSVWPDVLTWFEADEGEEAYLSNEIMNSGDYSLLIAPSANSRQVKALYTDQAYDYGFYSGWFYMAPNSNWSTDAYFYFQYRGLDEHYWVTIYPAESDNPGVRLRKRLNGEVTVIGECAPLTSFNKWYRVTIERAHTGQITIRIYDPETDTETVAIDVNDNDIFKEGYVGVGGFYNSSYWDDIGYESFVGTKPETTNALTVYPNPARNELYINHASSIDGAEYMIVDVMGKTVMMGNFTMEKPICVERLGSGLYFVQIKSDIKTACFRFKKQ